MGDWWGLPVTYLPGVLLPDAGQECSVSVVKGVGSWWGLPVTYLPGVLLPDAGQECSVSVVKGVGGWWGLPVTYLPGVLLPDTLQECSVSVVKGVWGGGLVGITCYLPTWCLTSCVTLLGKQRQCGEGGGGGGMGGEDYLFPDLPGVSLPV